MGVGLFFFFTHSYLRLHMRNFLAFGHGLSEQNCEEKLRLTYFPYHFRLSRVSPPPANQVENQSAFHFLAPKSKSVKLLPMILLTL